MLNALAFPGLGWWPLAFVGTPLILGALAGRRLGGSLLVGLAGGAAFWGVHIFWITVYLGPVPWLALGGLETVFFAVGCALIALAWRFGDRMRARAVAAVLTPLVVAALWTLREQVTSTWPYGGFSWGRLAFSQSESPVGDLVAWVGAPGLTFLIAWASALVVVAVRGRGLRRIAGGGTAVLLLGAMLLMPSFPVAVTGTTRVAAVQGDADAGLFAEYRRGEILDDHYAATEPLFGEDVDLVVWPENAADVSPLVDRGSAARLDRVTEELSAPLVVGTLTVDERERVFNSLLLWEGGRGATDQYDKIHPVPFAEYLPDREFWYPLAPDLLSLIPRDYSIGERDNVFDIDVAPGAGGGDATLSAGLAICFDIVDDALVRRMVTDGAEVILAPTNNADFGRTDESVQQLAIARIRAMETGRSVVNTSTVGTSAIIDPTGATLARLPTFEPDAMVEEVPLSTTTTPASAAGQGIELGVGVGGLAGLLLLGLATRRRAARA